MKLLLPHIACWAIMINRNLFAGDRALFTLHRKAISLSLPSARVAFLRIILIIIVMTAIASNHGDTPNTHRKSH